MNFEHSQKAQDYIARVKEFMRDRVAPFESQIYQDMHELNPDGNWRNWKLHPKVEALKVEAREAGLSNLFLPDAELAHGLTTLEYAPLAEEMGKMLFAPEIFNCNAPDTGNMEVLYHFGSEQQKETWLKPLLAGEIRSVFGMTEPDVASSDATNMQATIEEDGDEIVVNGKKMVEYRPGSPERQIHYFYGAIKSRK